MQVANNGPIVDGFTYTLSRPLTENSYYQSCVAQLENLRRANGYHARWYNVPDDLNQPIPGYGTLEYQVRSQPGSYLWGFMFSTLNPDVSPSQILIQVTDACTESHLFSDYTLASSQAETSSGFGMNRPPCLLSQPYLLMDPALINVELSNRSADDINCQLLLLIAEPSIPVGELQRIFRNAGYQV